MGAQTSDTDTFNGKTAQVYGWGTTSSGGQSSSKLLEVSVPVVTSTQCATSMGPMEAGQICAGGEAGKDSCQGDSGGPLSYDSCAQLKVWSLWQNIFLQNMDRGENDQPQVLWRD